MKKTLLLFIFLSLNLFSFSQTGYDLDHWKLGLFAGPQLSTAVFKVNREKQQIFPKYGFQAGIVAKRAWDKKLWAIPSLFYSLKGYDVRFKDGVRAYPPDTSALGNNTLIHTAELCMSLQYDITSHIILRSGFSFDIQIAGKEKFYSTRHNGEWVNRKMKFNFYDHGPLGINWISAAGYENNKVVILFQYSHGLTNMSNHDGATKYFHRSFGIAVGKYL